jgi:hypothetical protein
MFLLLQNSAPKLTHLYEMHAILIHHMKGNCGARGGGDLEEKNYDLHGARTERRPGEGSRLRKAVGGTQRR